MEVKFIKMKITEEEIKKARDEAYERFGCNACFGNGFNEGVKYALNKMDLKEEKKGFVKIQNSLILRKYFNEIYPKKRVLAGNANDFKSDYVDWLEKKIFEEQKGLSSLDASTLFANKIYKEINAAKKQNKSRNAAKMYVDDVFDLVEEVEVWVKAYLRNQK